MAPRPRTRQTHTLPHVNMGRVFRAVQCPGGTFGVVDEETQGIWHAFATAPRTLEDKGIVASLPTVHLPTFPSQYGSWHKTAIGGVSNTMRRRGCIRTAPQNVSDSVVVFATHAPDDACVRTALAASQFGYAIGSTEHSEEFGFATEIVVHASAEVEHVCAVIARAGARVLLEDPALDTKRELGIERLDRVDSEIVAYDTNRDAERGTFGLRRGRENWKFSWLPAHWERVPITWDHLVENVRAEPLDTLPRILRQHVARKRLDEHDYDECGMHWEPATRLPCAEELEDFSTGRPDPLPIPRRRIVIPPPELKARLYGAQPVALTLQEFEAWQVRALIGDLGYRLGGGVLVQGADGTWYQPVNTRDALERYYRGRREVSARLTDAQSQQLISALYVHSVEQHRDPRAVHVAALIMFRYLLVGGYMARWIGKYNQNAHNVGNGRRFRNFVHLEQYVPSRMPSHVLSRRCNPDGTLSTRGSKGTRSKYSDKDRYVPQRRLRRSLNDESEMRV